MLEVEAYRSGMNVALNQPATQSSTHHSNDKFAASKAVDGLTSTFSHTSVQDGCSATASTWLEVELDGYPIESVTIKNRACGSEELQHCLCRLSQTVVMLLDETGDLVDGAMTMTGDMCGVYEWSYEYSKASKYCKVFDG